MVVIRSRRGKGRDESIRSKKEFTNLVDAAEEERNTRDEGSAGESVTV